MTILSNADVGGVRDQVRMNALESFEFFANSVLGCSTSTELCERVQEVVEDQEDTFFETRTPRAFAVAMYAWLESKGYPVFTIAKLPHHEVLHWLDLLGAEEKKDVYVVLDVLANGVQVRWV